MNWDGASSPTSRNNPRNPFDYVIDIVHFSPPVVPVFRDNVMIKNSNRASYLRGEQVVYERQVFADNGGTTLNAYNQARCATRATPWHYTHPTAPTISAHYC